MHGRTELPEGYTAVGRGSDTISSENESGSIQAGVSETAPSDAHPPAPMSNAVLVVLGVLGGIYALWTVGWVIGGLRLQGTADYLIADVMFQGSFWLAVGAAPIWFGATLLLTQRVQTWVRIAWLLVGAALLVPWPFLMVGAVGQ